jgi:ergothioneine biosynthesis protein EgtB
MTDCQSAGAEARTDLFERFRCVRAATVVVCAPLSPEDMVAQSMPDASPAKWHLAHTTWFFETFILCNPAFGNRNAYNPGFGFLFNSYYDAVGSRHSRAKRGLLTRPAVEEIRNYRGHVDAAMAELLAGIDDATFDCIRPLVEIGLNHEQQHLELLLTDIKHLLAQNPLRPAYCRLPPQNAASSPALSWNENSSGIRWIGHEGGSFAFDNEGPRHRVFLEAFSQATRPATCGEYLVFMEEGGYSRPEFWLSDGWQARQTHGWEAPLYWERHDNCWNLFTLGGLRELVENEPVGHLSYYEADAFARWSGARLPTEAEWECCCRSPALLENSDLYAPVQFHPGPVTTDCQLWEWTQSAYGPYPGYRPVEGALGEYNGKFMCNQMVLRGGSCLTPRSHLRPTYRNFFPPEARWQFTGVRLARSS